MYVYVCIFVGMVCVFIFICTYIVYYVPTHVSSCIRLCVYILYSGKLSREKTFADFEV